MAHFQIDNHISGYVPGTDDNDYTQGTGFLGIDEYNNPMDSLFNIDPSFQSRNEFGTDIYILGFIKDNNWEAEVINSLLDSFMAAIIRKQLVVKLNDITIDSESIGKLIHDEILIQKNNIANFVSQYRILTGDLNVKTFDIETEYGNCELYVMPLSEEDEQYATHKCVMVRYPLMKIKTIDLGGSFRVSAMCIIGDNALGKQLLKIENPQHIDWEPKRMKTRAQQVEMSNVLKNMRIQISEKVMECLKLGDIEPIDPNGAGDFLPDLDFGDGKKEIVNTSTDEKVTVSKIKENISVPAKSSQGTGEGLTPDVGDIDDTNVGDLSHPEGNNNGGGGENHPGGGIGSNKPGDDVVFRKSKLAGVRYNVISTDKENGKVRVVFTAPIDYEKCYLQINLLDDAHNRTPIIIDEITIRDSVINNHDEDGVGPFSIKKNEKIVIDAIVDKLGYFASEVKVVCK